MGQYARNTEFLSPHNKRSLSLENSKLDFRPEITPSDPEWIKWRTIFLTSLRNKSVQDVLSTHFTSAEQSYILPHPLQDDTLRIQTEDGQLYKTLLKPGHRFQNVPDNLATKLTMLHFGLPVQPATLNNIFGSGKAEDMSDETDEENEVPRVRKFLYSERPLEFLERYEKRSYGHPSLRRAVTRCQPPAVDKGNNEDTYVSGRAKGTEDTRNSKINPPMLQNGPPTVFQRGGAGSPEYEDTDEDEENENKNENGERGNEAKNNAYELGGQKEFSNEDRLWGASSRVSEKGERTSYVVPGKEDAPKVATGYNDTGSWAEINGNRGNTFQARHNIPRIIAKSAGKPKAQSWDDYMEGQCYLNGLQRKSYIKDQSIIQPGKEPLVPLYGQSRELMFRLGDQLPTVYAQRLTPTDIMQLYEENQYLRNRILDRETKCQICDEVFENYKIEEIAAHHREHRLRLQEDGECAWCGDVNYGFMTVSQRRFHLKQHFDREDTILKTEFWKDHRCPICNQNFTRWKPGDIINHCLNKHSPGLARYCDKCGVNTYNQTIAEKYYHQMACRDQSDRPHDDLKLRFCEKCGKDTSLQTPAQAELHDRDCLMESPTGNWFCPTCGFSLNTRQLVSSDAIEEHRKNCKPPGGFKRQFCQHCGTNLKNLEKDPAGLASHKKICFQKLDPTADASSAKENLKVLNNLKADIKEREARHNILEAQYRTRMRDLKEGEDRLSGKLQALGNFVPSSPPQKEPTTKDRHSIIVDHGKCQFHGCSRTIGRMDRDEMFLHYYSHADDGSKWNCPFKISSGKQCPAKFDLKSHAYEEEIKLHYIHRHGDIQGIAKWPTSSFLTGERQKPQMDNPLAKLKLQINRKLPPAPQKILSIDQTADDTRTLIEAIQDEVNPEDLTSESASETPISDDDPNDPNFQIAVPQRPQRQIKRPKRYAVGSGAAAGPGKDREGIPEEEAALLRIKGKPAKANTLRMNRKRKGENEQTTSSKAAAEPRKRVKQAVEPEGLLARKTRSGANINKRDIDSKGIE